MKSLGDNSDTMRRRPLPMSTVLRVNAKGQGEFVSRRQAGPLAEDLGIDVALIQALIPLGLEAVHDVLRREVETLAGARYAREGGRPGRPVEQGAWVRVSRGPEAADRLSARARPDPRRRGPARDLPALAAAPGAGSRLAAPGAVGPQLPAIRGVRRGGARSLRLGPVDGVPPLH